MTDYPFGDRPRRRPRPRRSRKGLRAAVGFVLLAVTFAVGLALGEALHDSPNPGGTVTYVRTLEPIPQKPAGP